MVERARLESVYTGNGIEGSNPSLSALKDRNHLFIKGFGLFHFGFSPYLVHNRYAFSESSNLDFIENKFK